MDKNNFDWTLVRSFLAVLDAGSLMGAAKRLGAQQPTLSRHIAELEAQLGSPLFERTGRGVLPTAVALRIADAAREMEGGAAALGQALDSQRNDTVGTVRISASQLVATLALPSLMADFQREEPGIQIEVVASDAITNLLRREADIAIRMVRPSQSSLVTKKIADVTIVACAHRSYLERAGTPKRPEDLFAHRLIGFDRDDGIIRGFATMGQTATKENFAIRTDDTVVIGQMIAAGCGIGFAATYALRHWNGVVAILPMLNIQPLPCWLTVHREIRGSAIVRRVYDYLGKRLPAALA
ncbi:MAG: LysR family transcriptional regulator [Rhodocyclaceae bacterium]|nr:LysR family transcriptional regulator [Rhodocyclaceae bacterium]